MTPKDDKNIPVPAPEDDYSLEEILAEYGGSLENRLRMAPIFSGDGFFRSMVLPDFTPYSSQENHISPDIRYSLRHISPESFLSCRATR